MIDLLICCPAANCISHTKKPVFLDFPFIPELKLVNGVE